MKTVLIIGIDSVIGRSLENVLIQNGWTVFGTSRRFCERQSNVFYLDLANVAEMCLDLSFDVVYLCANVTKIKDCEENPDYAKLINVEAQIKLAEYFLNQNAHIVYLSSNAVFSGQKPAYKTTDLLCPKTYYGECKSLVEEALLRMSGQITIVRLTKVFTPEFPLILQWRMDLRNNKVIEPFSDLRVCPISVFTVSQCLKEIAEKVIKGIVHLSGSTDVSYLDVAEYLAGLLNAPKDLIKGAAMLDSRKHMEYIPVYASLDMSESDRLFDKLDTSFATTMNSLYGDFSI